MNREITYHVYDADIVREGLQFQIDMYYEPKTAPMRRRIEIVLEALEPKPEEKILDIGCGVGTFAFHAAKAGARTTGIDYSPESINAAQSFARRYGMESRTSYVVGSALQLPFEKGSFDKVVCADFIEHITHEEKQVLCREIIRVLRDAGKAVIFTPNRLREDLGERYWKIRNRLFGDAIPSNDLHYGLTSRSEFENIMKGCGLNFDFRYADITRPFLARLPLARRALSLNLLWTAWPKAGGSN